MLGLFLALVLLCMPAFADVLRSPSGDGGQSCSSNPCTYQVNCARGCNPAEIQTALNEAWLGDTIELEAGQTWDVRNALVLFRKTSGEGFLTIRTSTPDDRLPADDTRITPTYLSLLPTLRGVSNGARIIHVEQTRNAVENYRFLGIHVTASDQVELNDMLRLWAPGIHTDVSYTPNQFIFDRCIFRGHPLRSTLRAMRLNVRNGVVKNSFFEDFKGQSDAQAISSLNAPGPLYLHNNFFSATGENIMTGGAIPDVPGLVVADYRIEFNAMVKDPAQFMRELWRPGMYVRKGKIVQSGRGFYKALDSGTTGDFPPVFPLTTVNRAGRNPLTLSYVRPIAYDCPPEYCVLDNGIRWQLNEVLPAVWKPDTEVREGDLISYSGPGTGNRTVTYYAARDGVTGSTPPFGPLLPFNPQPQTCTAQYCVDDGTTQWQRYNGNTVPWWVNKNLLEFKGIDGAVVRWNVFSGSWTDGQTGYGISFKPENQDPSNGWIARTENIDFSYNVVTDVERPFNWQGKGDYGTGIARNWRFHNNLIYGTRQNRNYAISMLQDVNNVTFTQNTMLTGRDSSLMLISAKPKRTGLIFTDNIVQRGVYGIKMNGAPEGLPSITAGWDDYRIENNIIEGLLPAIYPPGNFNIPVRQLGFLDVDGGDFRTPGCDQNNCPGLKQFQSSLSSTDSIGANPDLLPQIRGLKVTATDRAALFTWELTNPIAPIPCVAEISTNRDLSTIIPDLNPAAFVRPDTDRDDSNIMGLQTRMFRAGRNVPLDPDTVYWYRLHCGGDIRSGSFRTVSPLSGTADVTVERVGSGASGTVFSVFEYGTQYSRGNDSITNGVLSGAIDCTDTGNCAAPVPGDRGSILYHRVYDIGADGSVLYVHPVSVTAIE